MANHKLKPSKYFVAASKASPTLSGETPLPMLVGSLPPALPPIIPETVLDHAFAEAPALLAPYDDLVCLRR